MYPIFTNGMEISSEVPIHVARKGILDAPSISLLIFEKRSYLGEGYGGGGPRRNSGDNAVADEADEPAEAEEAQNAFCEADLREKRGVS